MRTWSVLLGALLASGTIASTALANGRFPESLRVVEDPKNADRLFLGATYGLLLTEDRGKNWYYICEKAFAFDFIEGDPMLEVMPDGTLLSGIYLSLNMSNDCGCSWKYSLGEPDLEGVFDISVDSDKKVVAMLTDSTTLPRKSRVHESSDNGKSWRKLSDLPGDIIDSYTIDVAPSDSSRIYLSALSHSDAGNDRGVLLASKNRGMTWQQYEIPGTNQNVQPYIAVVHPKNPDEIFVRTDEWIDNVDPSANDALLHSVDGGATWKELFKKGGKLLGFALSPDASTVLVGYGDPLQAGGRSTEPADLGLYKASTKDFVFEKIYSAAVSCLRWTTTGLYVCNTQFFGDLPPPPVDFELGFRKDADFTLNTANPFTVLLDLTKVKGPLGCSPKECLTNWKEGTPSSPPVCQQFQASCDVQPGDAGLSCGSGATTGAGGAGGSSGTTTTSTGTAGAGTTSTTTGATGGTGGSGGGGCGCHLPAKRTTPWNVFGIIVALGLTRLRRPHAHKEKE